jgi:hypothetical protein
MNKKKVIIGAIIITTFVMLAIAPSVGQHAQSNVKSDSTGTSCHGVNYWGSDMFGETIVKGTFTATWSFSCQNGNLVHGDTPTNTAHAIYTFVSWVNVHNSHWTTQGQNHVAYGNVGYHVGFWVIAENFHIHQLVTVKPNSYGAATGSAGSGEYN